MPASGIPIRNFYYFRSRSGNDQRLNRTVAYDFEDYPGRIYLSDGMALYDSGMILWGFSNWLDQTSGFTNTCRFAYAKNFRSKLLSQVS